MPHALRRGAVKKIVAGRTRPCDIEDAHGRALPKTQMGQGASRFTPARRFAFVSSHPSTSLQRSRAGVEATSPSCSGAASFRAQTSTWKRSRYTCDSGGAIEITTKARQNRSAVRSHRDVRPLVHVKDPSDKHAPSPQQPNELVRRLRRDPRLTTPMLTRWLLQHSPLQARRPRTGRSQQTHPSLWPPT